MILSKDWRDFDTSAFFIKVDARSRRFLQNVLAAHKLEESSAAVQILRANQLADLEDVALVPSSLLNSRKYQKHLENPTEPEAFMLHFPAWKAKTSRFLPLLKDFKRWKITVDHKKLREAAERIRDQMRLFWEKQNRENRTQ